MSSMPKLGVPRLPLVPDVMQRARVPADLEAVTTRGDEVDPAAVGMTADAIESVWDAVVDVYKGGDHIPEFGRHGKAGITIGHLLSHRAGIPRHPAATMDLDHLDDRDALVRAFSDARPDSAPSKRMAYHAVMGGAILGEIVHRVAGQSIRDVLAAEVLDPLGLRWTNYGVDPLDVPKVGLSYLTGPPTPPPLSTVLNRILGASLGETVRKINDPRFLTGVVPSGNVVTTANEFSLLFEMLRRGGELGGVRVLQPETVANAVRSETPLEVDYSLGVPVRYGKGFMLGEKRFSLFGPDTENVFGHLGFSNILGWADPDRALAVGLITSGKPVYYPEVFCFLDIMRRIGDAAPQIERSPR